MSLKILIVEDEWLIAEELKDQLEVWVTRRDLSHGE